MALTVAVARQWCNGLTCLKFMAAALIIRQSNRQSGLTMMVPSQYQDVSQSIRA